MDKEIKKRLARNWFKLIQDVICFEKMYDPKKTWPEESLKRYGEYLKVINK